MSIEKYGVEDRKELLEKELKEVRDRLRIKTASETVPIEELEYLSQREKDLQEAIASL